MGGLPHGRDDQSAARNHGRHNGWLDAKKSGNKEFAHMPLTMGYYNRDDLPFYYALADAFTICDQNFCSSLTPTTPNRLHLWTGTVRAEASMESKAHVNNSDTDYDSEVSWKTFPERLEEQGISWRIYQNEISLPTGLEGERDAWLTNFTDNPLEWFTQYRVRFSAAYQAFIPQLEKEITADLEKLEVLPEPRSPRAEKRIAAKRKELEEIRRDKDKWTPENFAKLSEHEANLHRKAFTINDGDTDYRKLDTLTYREGGIEREMQAPKGDVLHQFRQDVQSGNLPMVSWLVPPERFSDHPGSPWYGAWFLSETFDILTKNPEVWKKTIFILCYDENDGYFDHVPPFVPPHPNKPNTGKASAGIDCSLEQVSEKQENNIGPIGLGFRVPLLIASPWSRGGFVNSEVFDHTSIIKLLEAFLAQKTGKTIRETNITQWRRTVCGNLTSTFHPYEGGNIARPDPVDRTAFLGSIYEARNKPLPAAYKTFSAEEAAHIREHPEVRDWLPSQERGTRPSCALPYELRLNGGLDIDRKTFLMEFAARNEFFGLRSSGAPFHVYSPVKWGGEQEPGHTWDYAVAAGDRLTDTWPVADFENGVYHFRAHGPNGFYREFHGDVGDPALEIYSIDTQAGDIMLRLQNRDTALEMKIVIEDLSYGSKRRELALAPSGKKGADKNLILELAKSHCWYDFRVSVAGSQQFWQRFSGRVENGRGGISDPSMAGTGAA
jgi:phospholipase C